MYRVNDDFLTWIYLCDPVSKYGHKSIDGIDKEIEGAMIMIAYSVSDHAIALFLICNN